MGRYVIRRILFMVLVLWLVSLLTFLIFVKLPPGDPARRAAGRRSTPETIQAVRETLGLDKPVWVQYGRFAKGLVPWPGLFLNEDVYFSWSDNVPIRENISNKLPVTVTLAVGSAVVFVCIGVPLGVLAAIRRRTYLDKGATIFAILGVSLPVFWVAFVLLYLFSFKFGFLPGSGLPRGVSPLEGVLSGHFILPWVTVALAYAALYTRMTRSNLIETMSEDYIRTARSKGVSERRVIFKHGLRSAITPMVTMIGMDLGTMLGGLVITETVFNLDGIGRYLVQSLTRNDFPATMGVTVFAAFFIVVANLLVDVFYAFLDPRVRYN